ncbi:MAG: hypothetical protein RIF32_16590 [Leptospirales bacterium]|jgi:hypothetical protein
MAAADSSPAADQDEIDRLRVFKMGYGELIDRQNSLARTAQQLLSSSILTGEDRNKLADRRQSIDQSLKELQKLGRELSTDLHPGNLEKTATREYHNIFSGDVTDHRLAYAQFLKTHEFLKRYYSQATRAWQTLTDAFTDARISDNSEIRRQIFSNCLRPASDANDSLGIFIDRMARLLNLQPTGVGVYSPEIQYQLSTVFTQNLNEWLRGVFEHIDQESARIDAAQLGAASIRAETRHNRGKSQTEPAKSPPVDSWRLDASGGAAFNQTPHYYFQYDPRVLEQERLKFADVIYADTHMGADQEFIKSDFILNVSRKATPGAAGNVEQEYVQFLHTFFNLVIDISMLNVDVPPGDRDIFVYHLGPHSFYNLTIKFLQEVNTGALHRRAAGKRVITKFLPGELIKKTIIEWWRAEILSRVVDKQDDPAYLKRITNSVRQMHGNLSQKAIEEYAKLPDSVKSSKSRPEIFRENMSNWMGATNIIIFRRFLKPKQ